MKTVICHRDSFVCCSVTNLSLKTISWRAGIYASAETGWKIYSTHLKKGQPPRGLNGGDAETFGIFIRRLHSSRSRSIASEIQINFHWIVEKRRSPATDLHGEDLAMIDPFRFESRAHDHRPVGKL